MLYLLIFLSGAAALVYEVVWSRQLATFLGITSHANTVVLATFMAGLALGSRFLGPRADRRREPLRLFGSLELGIGLYALAALWLLPFLETLYAFLASGRSVGGPGAHLVRFLMAAAALLLPTFWMGGTLPALVRGFERRGSPRTRSIATIYGVNTLGAAAGAAAAGYLLLPSLGIRRTLLVAVAANLLVAAAVLLPRRSREESTAPGVDGPSDGGPPAESGATRRRLLLALAISGFASLALQLAWVRALTLILGSSVYAFSLTLATYLAGIALGSLLFGRLRASRLSGRPALAWAAGLAAACGFLAILGLPLIQRLPEIFLAAYRAGIQESFIALQGLALAMASSVILAPTLCLGALFPLLASLSSRRPESVGRDVGSAAAANSVGTILGILVAGLVALPSLGVQLTLIVAAGLLVLVGAFLWTTSHGVGSNLPTSHWGSAALHSLVQGKVILVLFAALAVALPRWDPVVMTSGVFINASRILAVPEGQSFREWIRDRNKLLFYAEGADGNVSVREVADERLLVINGKTDGSLRGDRKTQLAIAHLPLLMHERPRSALVIGLGTGMSAGAAMAHEMLERLDVLEISPEVVEASSYFREVNHDVLQDPRLELIVADARNYLRTTDRLYDVIISEPSNPWISGISNLFTREFFTLALRRLAVGGVLSQWFHTYNMSDDDLRSVLRTFREVFPHVTVWAPQLGDLILIGSRTPPRLSLSRFDTLVRSESGQLDLLPFDLDEPRGWARMYLLGPRELDQLVAGAELNTDDRPRVEFSAPKSLYSETTIANMSRLVAHIEGQALPVPLAGLGGMDPGSGRLEAFGLSFTPAPGIEPEVAWLVSWTELKTLTSSDEPSLASTFAIGNRRVVRWDGVEISRGDSASRPDPPQLLEHLGARLPGELAASGALSLADGTPAVWAETSDPAGDARSLGLVWSCGETADGYSRFAATLPAPGGGYAALGDLASRLRCTADTG